MTGIRAGVVSLLVDIDWDRSVFPTRLFHQDGKPFTDEDNGLVGIATFAEIEAAKRYLEAVVAFAEQDYQQWNRVVELTVPYFAPPDVSTLGDVMALMAPDELAELRQILDAIAPDGHLFMPDPSP